MKAWDGSYDGLDGVSSVLRELSDHIPPGSAVGAGGDVIDPEAAVLCGVCMGVVKPGLKIVICKCGSKYHSACWKRISRCPKCEYEGRRTEGAADASAMEAEDTEEGTEVEGETEEVEGEMEEIKNETMDTVELLKTLEGHKAGLRKKLESAADKEKAEIERKLKVIEAQQTELQERSRELEKRIQVVLAAVSSEEKRKKDEERAGGKMDPADGEVELSVVEDRSICRICYNNIKLDDLALKCGCRMSFHPKCAVAIRECPMCGRGITEEEVTDLIDAINEEYGYESNVGDEGLVMSRTYETFVVKENIACHICYGNVKRGDLAFRCYCGGISHAVCMGREGEFRYAAA